MGANVIIKTRNDLHDLRIERLEQPGHYLVSGPGLPMQAVDDGRCRAILRAGFGADGADMIMAGVLRSCGWFVADLQPDQLRALQDDLAR